MWPDEDKTRNSLDVFTRWQLRCAKKTSTSYSSIKRVPLACVAISGSWAAMTRSRHAAVELTTVRQVREKKAPQIPWWMSIFSLQKKIWHPTSPIFGSTHSNLPRSGPQRCLLQVPVERWMGRHEPTCYLLTFAQLVRPLENEFHSRECKLLNHKVQTDNKHCATLARIFNQGTAIAKQNQHFILSVNLYHISDWEAESVKDLPPEPESCDVLLCDTRCSERDETVGVCWKV